MPIRSPGEVGLWPAWVSRLLEKLGYILESDYTVQITNATTDTIFSEIDIFYNRTNQPGVVILTDANIGPGETRYFDLGKCALMESYVVGFFVGQDLVAQLPADGSNMTPESASMYKPSDQDRCVDGWAISD